MKANYSWFKLKKGIFDDTKVKIIMKKPNKYAFFTLWIKLLDLAADTFEGGYIRMGENIPYTSEMLTDILEMEETLIKEGLELFRQLQLIDIDDKGIIFVRNWSKHQNLEEWEAREEKRKQANRERQKRFKAKGQSNSADFDRPLEGSKIQDMEHQNEEVEAINNSTSATGKPLSIQHDETVISPLKKQILSQSANSKHDEASDGLDKTEFYELRRKQLESMIFNEAKFLEQVVIPDDEPDRTFTIDDLFDSYN